MKGSGITLEKYIFFAHLFRIFKIYVLFFHYREGAYLPENAEPTRNVLLKSTFNLI